jgi:dTDP-glucose pyrophosphorylase
MKNFEKFKLKIDSTVKEALKIIDEGAKQIGLVLDEDNQLIGTLTDGDIRRGILRGVVLEDSIELIINRTPIVCTVNQSKDEILRIASEKKIYKVPIVNLEGVLIRLEEINTLIKQKEYSNSVVLMVGGLGSRLNPLTMEKPKPLLKVGHKPILETIIGNFSTYGFKNIILSVHYKSQMIENYFGDGSSFGVNITYIHEEKRMGTAGGLSMMKDELNVPFFVMNGDLLCKVNFIHMLKYHLENNTVATMGVREYDLQIPYGIVNVDNHRITSIEEKPTQNLLVNAGIYILENEVLNYIPDDTFFDMPTLFKNIIADKKRTISYPISEYWLDIGRISDFEQANREYNKVFKHE